ncbi:MAG: hypothetical protein JSS96_00280, partial [Bacteroidetes bacterium]|nr:hypothetical protein [Bacteroidota bacterium]
MKKIISVLAILFCQFAVAHGITKRVLFLGNSYTYVNNLPQMVADVAASVGDTLIYDYYAPGSYSIGNHSLDPTSI